MLVEAADVLLWLGEPDDAPAHPRVIRLHPRADQAGRTAEPVGTLAVSSKTGLGLSPLLEQTAGLARSVLPAEDAVALNRRQALHLAEARDAVAAVQAAADVVLVAEQLRAARSAFDRLTGRAGVEDVLDALFGRFCLGK